MAILQFLILIISYSNFSYLYLNTSPSWRVFSFPFLPFLPPPVSAELCGSEIQRIVHLNRRMFGWGKKFIRLVQTISLSPISQAVNTLKGKN